MHSVGMLRLGILGYPIKHTLSPRLHAEIMRIMNVNGQYKAYEIAPEQLPESLEDLGQRGIRGLNVTIPHKIAVMSLMDKLHPEAELAGAVNTVVMENFGAHKTGYNTDITGFIRSLPPGVTDRLPESSILVLGSGGSARAVLTALIGMGTADVTFAVRSPNKAVSLTGNAELIKQYYSSKTQINVVSLFSLPSLESFQGVVNTTPVGMWPEENATLVSRIQLENLPAGAFVYDLIYRPLQTRLLQDAAELGYLAINGLDMLIHQGVASFELWQDTPVPTDLIDPLRQHLTQALAAETH
ncbi:MAG TPA: shikimate dehydrogenase [Coleofasciculaceae cyanobacterium]